MPSSKGGKEFAEQEFRYTISELTRAKLNGFYREAIDSLFKNFQIKFWLQVCSTLYKWRRVNVSVCACTCGREPAGTWLNYECKWAWILPTVRSVSQWTCFPFFTHPFCSSFLFSNWYDFPIIFSSSSTTTYWSTTTRSDAPGGYFLSLTICFLNLKLIK